jgi:hypothetical protein
MPTPSWLRSYWQEQLSVAVQDWELAGGPPMQLQALFEQMLTDWQRLRRKPLSEYSVATYVTQTREWLASLPLTETNSVLNPETGRRQHVALSYFNFPAAYWAELTLRSREKMQERTQHLLSLADPNGIIERGRELLQHEDWAALAAGIITMVGRRVGEVLLAGEIAPKSDYSLLFSGRLKLRGKPDYTFEIPTLCEAALVGSAWERLRTHPELLAMQLPLGEPSRTNLDRINGRLYPKVRAAVTHFFAGLVPSAEEEEGEEQLFSHLFRALYGTLAVWRYCPQWVDPDTFMAKILGHSYLARVQGQERLNYLSQHFYHRFVILGPDGRLDGRRGIALGEPGVRLLEGLLPQEKSMNQHQKPETSQSQGKKRRKKSTRESKTGFTLVKPRNVSGKRFDQIAKDHDLYWKDDDETFVLLLDTYDAHQQCLQQPGRPLVPLQLSPEDLGLPPALVALVREAMQQSGQEQFRDFLQDALKRESKTLIGLAKVKKEREQERPDFSQVPTSELLKTRRQPEAYERIRRAIATIMEHNRQRSDPNERWYISQTLLRDFTGAHPRFIKPVLDANAALLERHHQHFGILPAHNRTPAPKLEPIAKVLSIAEHPADLSVLDEIVLPAFSEGEEVSASNT